MVRQLASFIFRQPITKGYFSRQIYGGPEEDYLCDAHVFLVSHLAMSKVHFSSNNRYLTG